MIQAVNVEGSKMTDQQTVAETFDEHFVATAGNVTGQSKNNLINHDNNNIDNFIHFMEQSFNNLTFFGPCIIV